MGVSIWVRLKRDIPGLDPLQTDGKLLAKAMDVLDGAARATHVRPLSDFYSASRKQAMAEIAGDELSDDEFDALADDHAWWPPSEGVASVETMIRWATEHAGELHRPEDVLADLRGFQNVLRAAVRDGVEFNIAISA